MRSGDVNVRDAVGRGAVRASVFCRARARRDDRRERVGDGDDDGGTNGWRFRRGCAKASAREREMDGADAEAEARDARNRNARVRAVRTRGGRRGATVSSDAREDGVVERWTRRGDRDAREGGDSSGEGASARRGARGDETGDGTARGE